MIYIPSYAWWLVLATTLMSAAALFALLFNNERDKLSFWWKILIPGIIFSLAVLAFFWEHFNLIKISGQHVLNLSHLITELIPLFPILAILGAAINSWKGWTALVALALFLDGLLLLFQPGPLVNHLFQLLSALALLLGVWKAVQVGRLETRISPVLLATSGGTGLFCEVGMVYI